VYAVSRSKKYEYPSNVVHRHIDLLTSADEMAKQLQGVEVEYVFFAAYMQKDTEKENWQVNGMANSSTISSGFGLNSAGDMLDNFLRALELTGTINRIKRILLVTGLKQYGVHLGQVKVPIVETDPWLRDAPFPPNFYYRQQDILRSFCEQHPNTTWTVTYPGDVIGFAQGNFMNFASGLGLYAAVSKELGGQEHGLAFPGSETCYTGCETFTASTLHAQLCEWAVLEPKAADQAFNVVNGDVQSWQEMWPRLARRFGMRVKADQFAAEESELATKTAMPMAERPPISVVAEEIGLKGRIWPSELESRVSLVKWSKQDEVKQAWARLAERDGLQKDAFEKATWGFLDGVIGRNFDMVASMSKAREAGWTG
jgi:hypothetical protein